MREKSLPHFNQAGCMVDQWEASAAN